MRHPPPFHVAGVALGGIQLGFAWQAWHLATSTFVLRGRRGTWRHPLAFCVAGVTWRSLFVTYIFHTPSLSDTVFHTTLSHTIFHPQLCHPPSFTQLSHTPSFTHNLSPTTLSHTIYLTPPFTHNFVTHHLSPTTLSHTIFHTQLCHTQSFTQNSSPTTLSHTTCHTTICQG